jgi:hypothetical protein
MDMDMDTLIAADGGHEIPAGSIAGRTEHEINELLKPVMFSRLNGASRQHLVFTEEQQDSCDFHDGFMQDPGTVFLFNKNTGDLYGACILSFKTWGNANICWVHTRCTYNRANSLGLWEYVNSGRLIWAYILNVCYKYYKGRTFIVMNFSIATATGYHLQMGMRPYYSSSLPEKGIKVEDVEMMVNYFEKSGGGFGWHPDYLEGTTEALLRDPQTVYLFYLSTSGIYYGYIPSILNSLPISSRPFSGGKIPKSRRYGKLKRKRGKSKRKRGKSKRKRGKSKRKRGKSKRRS